MSNRKQIGYSLSVWETLKEYNEATKWFEPVKNKKVEVAQMLSEEMSDNEEIKDCLIDRLFEYKDDIKRLLKKGEYCDIPSYHKESLEKDQQIADLEAKLAESEKRLVNCVDFNTWQKTAKENSELKQQLAEKEKQVNAYAKEIVFLDKKIETQKKNLEFFYDVFNTPKGEKTLNTINKDKISFAVEQLENVKEDINKYNKEYCFLLVEEDVCDKSVEIIDNQIKAIKEMNKA